MARAALARFLPLSVFFFPFSLSSFFQDPAVRAKADVVVVPVTVTDRAGRFVQGLTADQFEISEGGTRRTIVQFSAGRAPVSLGILLDIGGAPASDPEARVADGMRWAHTRRAFEALLTRLDAADEVSLAVFNHQVAAAPWTQDHAGVLRELDGLQPGGGNALMDAMRLVLPNFELARHQRKVLLLISDGNDTTLPAAGVAYPFEGDVPPGLERFSVTRQTQRQKILDSTRVEARKSGVAQYAIGIRTREGVPVDTELLKSLTTESGGYVAPLRDPSEMSAAVARICDDLQSQYLLAFEPGSADGKYHEIRVRTKDRQLRVRARAGYVAASTTPK